MISEENILKHFDKIFGTKVAKHIGINIPLLRKIFEKFEEELYVSSNNYNELRKEQIKIADKLYLTFSKEQQTLYERYWEVTNQLSSIDSEQMFYFGFLIAKELDKESKIIE